MPDVAGRSIKKKYTLFGGRKQKYPVKFFFLFKSTTAVNFI